MPLTFEVPTKAIQKGPQAVLTQGLHTVLILYHEFAGSYAQMQRCTCRYVPQPLARHCSRSNVTGVIQAAKDGGEYLHSTVLSGYQLRLCAQQATEHGEKVIAVLVHFQI